MSKRASSIPSKPRGALGDEPYRSALKAPDPFIIINQSPDRVYRMLSKSMLQKSGGFDRRGWEVLTADKNQGEQLGSEWGTVSAGTELTYGDLVVGFMPKERMEKKREVIRQTQNLADATLYRFRTDAKRLGAYWAEQDVENIQRPGRSEDF